MILISAICCGPSNRHMIAGLLSVIYVLPISLNAADLISFNAGGVPPPRTFGACFTAPPDTKHLPPNSEDDCLSFEEVYAKYFTLQGMVNGTTKYRDVMFFKVFVKYAASNKGNYNRQANIPYPFNITDVIHYFGLPDYKITSQDGDMTKPGFVYLFDYKGIRDYAIVLTGVDNKLTSMGFVEYKLISTGNLIPYQAEN